MEDTTVVEQERETAACWNDARVRMEVLLKEAPELAEGCREALTSDGPDDDDLLRRARSGEFGDQVFQARYGDPE